MPELSATSWEKRYAEGDTPWDLSGPTAEFIRLQKEPWFPQRGTVLVPGGGRGHDAIWLSTIGYEVDLVDFAPSALTSALDGASRAKTAVYAYRQDFFSLPKTAFHQERYDLLLEYTFFCAIDPQLRAAYADSAAALLKPGGLVVGLFFPLQTDKPPPPFPVSQDEITALFREKFDLSFFSPEASVGPRAGREVVGVFRRRPGSPL